MNKPSPTFWFLGLVLACVVWMLVQPTNSRSHDTRLKAAYADVNGGLKSTLGMFQAECGRYPTTAEGLQALITCPTNIPQRLWKGPYLDPAAGIPLDPWGHEYVYLCPGIHNPNSYDLYSAGPDGIRGDQDDIGNWQLGR